VGRAKPGIEFVELDIENPKSITSVANSLAKQHPELNGLINNARIMKVDYVQNGSEGERYDVRNYWNHWQRWRQHSA
jgi:short-subunit dehydrogenase involved in D-alanine esterification of teichoic acids